MSAGLSAVTQAEALFAQIRRAIIPQAILDARQDISAKIRATCDDLAKDPERIAEAEARHYAAKQQLEDAKRQLELVDADLYEDELYQAATNETKRKQALGKLRADSPLYREAEAAMRQAKAAVEQADIEVRRAENEQKVRIQRLGGMKAQICLYFGQVIE